MNVSRIVATAAASLLAVAAIGCSSTHTATAPMAVPAPPPEPVAAADTMPSHPALQSERSTEVAVYSAPPASVSSDSTINNAAVSGFVERTPQPDRN